MAYKSLKEFVEVLEREGELLRIAFPVDTDLEITEIADREMKKPGGGKALLFEQPLVDGKVSAFPLLINAYGSERRMELCLRRPVAQIVEEIAALLKAKPPKTLMDGVKLVGQGISLIHTRPATVSSGPCKEVIHRFEPGDSFDLGRLPILKCWPDDGGRFVTLPNVYTQDPDTGERNIGMYRMQVYDGKTTGMHWQVHKVGARHGRRYYETGKRMPVAVCLGGDPVLTFCATAPMPDGLDEILLGGYLRRKSVPLVKCETNDLMVPADSDFVLEGYVEPGETRTEGPFGDHTGFYTPPDAYPVFHLTAITHRKEAIYPATIVGIPPMEDYYLGTASVRIFFPMVKMLFPEIVDMHLPAAGVFHNLMVVSIKKQYPYHAFKIMHGLWGMGQMMFTKIMVIVDEDIDPRDEQQVLWWLCGNIEPQRDMIFTKGPTDSLDHASTLPNISSKVGIDATRKLEGEGYTHRSWPDKLVMTRSVQTRVDELLRQIRS
ncbi:MAG: menaquinone biosynthesis decarboxylase [Verrucomicrobiae bacterium]|nr:menaquinone biosynthesis decarboxylase [Verrucomicrobiae bacterium]